MGVTKIARCIPDNGPEEDLIPEVALGLELEEWVEFTQKATRRWGK